MEAITEVLELPQVQKEIKKAGLAKQYKKAKEYILSGNIKSVHLKKRKPKHEGIWQFRINRQYRAMCFFDTTILKVFYIDNHQNN